MKRKAEKQQPAGPLSAFAARKARQQAQPAAPAKAPDAEPTEEPPSKRARHSPEEEDTTPLEEESRNVPTRRASKRLSALKAAKATRRSERISKPSRVSDTHSAQENADKVPFDELGGEENAALEANGSDYSSLHGDVDGYESPTDRPATFQNFPLSKARPSKGTIVYADNNTMCIRIKEKMSLALIGQYDFWVKRGVVSLMGAKLHPSPRLYRVYAPSTHSLPVIKCVSGVDGAAELEIKSCHSGLHRLKDLSPLYHRIWNSKRTSGDKFTLKGAPKSVRRTFSVLYTASEDPLKRHLRPLHMDKMWSSTIRDLSQRGGQLRALICGPKGSGKSTFSRYLLNHLLSPAPQTDSGNSNTDGVAFLDLDPGQPEFSPMGQVYFAHLHSPFFGPPFTHPSLDESRDGTIIRAHHIGATSPKDDPDHYVLAAMDLLDRYRSLLATYPQCPLIINYPGWIFGLGLEVATWAVRSLGLSDVVYMSEKGPAEVVQPLALAARDAMIPLTTLPSQPTEFVSRSSAQQRSMQMQSYFHMSRAQEISSPQWDATPISRTRPISVDYAGPRQGIGGIMVMGSQIHPDQLHDVLDGAIVGLVAAESPNPIMGQDGAPPDSEAQAVNVGVPESGPNVTMEDSTSTCELDLGSSGASALESNITRTPGEGLPYLFVGPGSCNPLDPKASHCMGLALIRSINVSSRKLELVTPIPGSKIRNAVENGHGIVLVRGQLDNPNWALSEEYNAARNAEKTYRESVQKTKETAKADGPMDALDGDKQAKVLAILGNRTRRAGNVPWMTVIEDNQRQIESEKSLWKLRKRAYPGSESEAE